MQTSASPQQADWYPGGMPQPTYRIPTRTNDDAPLQELQNVNESASSKPPKASGPTIRQIRESMAFTPSFSALSPTPAPSSPPQKRKTSIFGGLFAVKEPTQMALNQVAAQMIAQHGSTSATKVPNVRMEKMPEYVPKVNSKWDGVPEVVKIRDRQEKDRQRATKRQSMNYSGPRPRSVDSSDHRGRGGSHSGRNSSSTSDSPSRGKSSTSLRLGAHSPNPHRFYAQSVNSSGDLASQQRAEELGRGSSGRPQTSRMTSGASFESVEEPLSPTISASPVLPAKYRSNASVSGSGSVSTDTTQVERPAAVTLEPSPIIKSRPIASLASSTTLSKAEPAKPAAYNDTILPTEKVAQGSPPAAAPEIVTLESKGPKVLPPPAVVKKRMVAQEPEAFLAGEAKPFELPDDDEEITSASELPLRQWGNGKATKHPTAMSPAINRVSQDLEKRPDSSRARLGLRASMVLSADSIPWSGRDSFSDSNMSPTSVSTRSSAPTTPKYVLPKGVSRFGKDKA